MEPSSNHEMQDEPAVVVQADGDSLAQPAESANRFAVNALDRWHSGAEQKWIADAHLIERLAKDAAFERFDVNGDVRQFGHW